MRGLQETLAIAAVSAGFAGNAAPAVAETHDSQAGGAQAARIHGEAYSANNIVAEGVHTKADLIRFAKGGADAAGHKDIDESWAKFGITPEVAKTMKSGEVCSTDGFMSQGRQPGPDASREKTFWADGSKLFERPLSVWGKTCYEAWVGEREDGTEVAVLKNCGNPEGHEVPRERKPEKPQAHVYFNKETKNAQGEHIATPAHIFLAEVACTDEGKKIDKIVKINHDPQKLADCDTGKPVTVDELKALGTQEWKLVFPARAHQREIAKRIKVGKNKGKMIFNYTNQMVPPKPVIPAKPGQPTVVNNEVCVAENSPNAEVCVIKTTVVQPPEVVVKPPEVKNVPPTGHLFPELHEYVKDRQPVCVEDVKDADGDIVKVKFRFVSTQGAPVGQQIGEVYKQDQADGSDTECVIYQAPDEPQEVTVFADLDDGHIGADGKADHVVTKQDVLHIVPDQFLK